MEGENDFQMGEGRGDGTHTYCGWYRTDVTSHPTSSTNRIQKVGSSETKCCASLDFLKRKILGINRKFWNKLETGWIMLLGAQS